MAKKDYLGFSLEVQKSEIIHDLKEYFSEDLKELFGESIENILEVAIKNYVDDHKTKWDEVNCVQSLDVLMIVANRLLKSFYNI